MLKISPARCNNDVLIILQILQNHFVILCNRQVAQTKSMKITLKRQIKEYQGYQ